MKWYQVKEQAAGEKRLLFLWYVYKFLGKICVKFLVFFITFFAFLGAKEPRRCSKKYLSIVGIEPNFFNQFKHFLSYSNSLIDRMEVFTGKFSPDNIVYANPSDGKILDEDVENGVFFICSHLGNIEMMRSFLFSNPNKNVDIFLAKEQCKIFNNFVQNIGVNTPVTLYPVEDINIETSMEIKDKISNGDIVIMAGDRISKNSTNAPVEFLGKKILLPNGTFKFAYIMEHPIYFVCVIKVGEKYKIYLKKFDSYYKTKNETIQKMQSEYLTFLQELVYKYPLQFYHFYDLFEED